MTSTANDTLDNAKLLPNHMLKIGVSYKAMNAVRLSIFNQFYTSPYRYSDVYNTTARNGAAELKAFNRLTTKVIMGLNKVFAYSIRYELINCIKSQSK